jgi:3-hydroxybutyryl-CoA dehydrogenase
MNVVVLGAGIMGSGIGQLAAMAGHDVAVRDVDEAAAAKGVDATAKSLGKLVEKQRLTAEEAEAAKGRLRFVTSLDGVAEKADVVIEAVPEILELKQRILAEVVEMAPVTALIGTNTSQLSITSIGTSIGAAADRLVGVHFFNPPVLMRLVELVRGLETSDDTLDRAEEFALGLGKEVVVCQKDSPGFLTSRVSAILRLECFRMLEEGLATAEDIDKAIRLAFNHPMGPLELGDFNGLDTYLHALESLQKSHGERFRPTVGLRNLVYAGRLGRKTGQGVFDYTGEA